MRGVFILAAMVSELLVACLMSATMTVAVFGQGNISASSASRSAQSARYVPTLAYDVTSVRECPPGPHNNGPLNSPTHSGRFSAKCVWVAQLIAWAYGNEGEGVDSRTQVVGGPEWVQIARSNEV